jgi:uncharacterized protein YegL
MRGIGMEITSLECSIIEQGSVPRKTAVAFFIIGTSGSMAGTRIGAVNSWMEQILAELCEMNADSADAEIEVALLEFSSGARWLTPNGPVKVENYYWSDLDVGGKHNMGEAFRMLEEKLHRKNGFMQRATRAYAPILFLISDGEPSDDYRKHLARLKDNGWFKVATKGALAIGDEANDHVLMEFTGSEEAVVRVPDGKNIGEKWTKMVKFISVDYDVEDQRADLSLTTGVYSISDDIRWTISNNNTLWQALQRIRSECGEDIFDSLGKFKSALADFLTGVGQDIVRLRKRTVEAVEMGVYNRLKNAEQLDLERVVRVEIKRMQDEGISEATAQEIVYALAKLFVNNPDDGWDISDIDSGSDWDW